MSKRRDDTTELEPESHREREGESRSYYYDDGTGYEVYDAEAIEEEDDGIEAADAASDV
ncbi:MAG TPA: hypothetical protein VM866_05315 [Pyrinomonadaceae bacterium]|jgi:hypothetical protein|nr:hypothetical protein [Pyrinomonadaceae bacterium]